MEFEIPRTTVLNAFRIPHTSVQYLLHSQGYHYNRTEMMSLRDEYSGVSGDRNVVVRIKLQFLKRHRSLL